MAGFANTSAALSATYSVTENPAVGFSNGTISETDTSQVLLTAGTTAGKIDLHYESGTVTTPLSISTGTTLTLSNLTDGLGRTVAFVKVTGIWIRLTETSPSGYISLAPGASNPLTTLLTGTTPTIIIKRFFMWNDDLGGIAVASGSADTIKLTASSGTIKILLGITGVSA